MLRRLCRFFLQFVLPVFPICSWLSPISVFTVIFKSARNLTLDVDLSGGSSTFNVTGFILCSGIPSGFLIFYDILCSFLNGFRVPI